LGAALALLAQRHRSARDHPPFGKVSPVRSGRTALPTPVRTRMPSIAGFFGASSIERLPTERGIKAQVEAFKAIERRVPVPA
jgi:hypothetical protein